jgi:hypothetical protein
MALAYTSCTARIVEFLKVIEPLTELTAHGSCYSLPLLRRLSPEQSKRATGGELQFESSTGKARFRWVLWTSTIAPGHTELMRSVLLTTSPAEETRTSRISKARFPSGTRTPCARNLRRPRSIVHCPDR